VVVGLQLALNMGKIIRDVKNACRSMYAVTVDEPEIKYQGFGGRGLVGGGPGALAPWAPLNPALNTRLCLLQDLDQLCTNSRH